MMKIVNNLVFIFIFFFCCFSALSYPNANSSLKHREIYVLPVVVGLNEPIGEEVDVLIEANKILLRDLNVELKYDKIVYYDLYIPFYECNLLEFSYLNSFNIDNLLDNQCKYKIVIFMGIQNQCLNLRGCAPMEGILQEVARMWTYLTENVESDANVLVHELGHIFGASHTTDYSIMCPYESEMKNPNFSQESLNQIEQTFEQLE